jgi:hypothetical protein
MHAPKANQKVLGILDEMVDITQKHPNLSTSFSALLGGNNVPSKWFMNKDERIANEKVKTLANKLVLMQTEAGVGGARMGQFLEQIIAKSKANETMTPETIKYLRDMSKHEYDVSLKDSEIAKKAVAGKPGIGRYDVPEYYEDYHEPTVNNTGQSAPILKFKSPSGEVVNFGGNITQEKILQLEQQGFSRIE